jgi:hypothetical protein
LLVIAYHAHLLPGKVRIKRERITKSTHAVNPNVGF